MNEIVAETAVTITQPQTGDEAWTVTTSWPQGSDNLTDVRIGLSRAGWWLVERLQHVIALVDAENAAVMVRE